jgi:hypothetical protein
MARVYIGIQIGNMKRDREDILKVTLAESYLLVRYRDMMDKREG